MKSLRTIAETSQKSAGDQIKDEVSAIKYNRYLGEVKTLNMVKDYLSEFRKRLTREEKENLIEIIMTK